MFQHFPKLIARPLFLIALLALLTACGGGGEASSDSGGNNTNGGSSSSGDTSGGSGSDSGGTGDSGSVIVSSTNPGDYQWTTLGSGTEVYIDRSYTYTSIPPEFEGLKLLQTANNDKASTGSSFISFEINVPATIHVAHVNEISMVPAWLQDWTTTESVLSTTDRSLHIYSKQFPAGSVVLGGNGSAPSMYTAFISDADSTSNDNADSNSDADTGTAELSWIPPTTNEDNTALTDLSGYKIYYGTSPGSYTEEVDISNPSLSTYVIDNLPAGTYYFAISAYDFYGNESAFSNEATKNIK